MQPTTERVTPCACASAAVVLISFWATDCPYSERVRSPGRYTFHFGGSRLMGFSSESSGFSLLGIALILVVGALWFVIAASVALKGDSMDRSNRMAQLYGYTVCLVAVIVALSSIASLLSAAIDRANPLQAEYSYGASFSSLEAYRATYHRDRTNTGGLEPARVDTLSDAVLRSRYVALVADRRAATTYRTSKTFVSGGVMLALALALFGGHWRWLRKPGLGVTPS